MEQPNFKKDVGAETSSLGRMREAINGKMLKILGPVAFAGLLSSCGESEQRSVIKDLEGKPGYEIMDIRIINEAKGIIDLAKQQKKTKFEREGSTSLDYVMVDIDTVSNSISYRENLASRNDDSSQIDHHEIHSYYTFENNSLQFFDSEATKKDGKELPASRKSIMADSETGLVLIASSFEEGELKTGGYYIVDKTGGPSGSIKVVPEAVETARERLSAIREVIGPIYNSQTNEFENPDGTPLPQAPNK